MTDQSSRAAAMPLPAVPAHPYQQIERERIEHLVLGRDRPPPRRVGRGKAKRREAIMLAPGIEERVQLRERWAYCKGTPETLERAREGAMMRLYKSGAINSEQWGSALNIAAAAELVGRDVAIRTASLETRVDITPRADGAFYEALGKVRLEMAYTGWRQQLLGVAAPVLDMIVGDEGITVIARRYRMHNRRAKKLLLDALDAWPPILEAVCKEVDPATLAAAHAGIL